MKPTRLEVNYDPADYAGTAALTEAEQAQERVKRKLAQLKETVRNMEVSGYESLADVLRRAYEQAAVGKGAERHANDEPFDQQVMQDGARRFGVGGLLFQAFKKSEESQRLPHDAAVRELLGAINYLAGAVIALEKKGGV